MPPGDSESLLPEEASLEPDSSMSAAPPASCFFSLLRSLLTALVSSRACLRKGKHCSRTPGQSPRRRHHSCQDEAWIGPRKTVWRHGAGRRNSELTNK